MSTLEIRNLHVNVEDKEILKGVDLTVNTGEVHALMGPNGNGKSTLLMTIMGHPRYKVTEGSITFDGQDVLAMSVDERSKAGLFIAMQYPQEVPGVTNSDFLKAAVNAHREQPVRLLSLSVCWIRPSLTSRWIRQLPTVSLMKDFQAVRKNVMRSFR